MMRWAWKILAPVIALVILWQWLDAPEHVAAHKANVERHREVQDRLDVKPDSFNLKKRHLDAQEFRI
jgi:hypothetical protein